jgi:predicted RNase H-like HicB family nuclease
MKNKVSKTYSYSVFYEQAPEGGYVAFIPVLPGCHTQGETLEATERNAKEAITLYLESLEAYGEPDSRAVVPVHRAGPLRNHFYAPSFGMQTYRSMNSSSCFELTGCPSANITQAQFNSLKR